MAKTRPVRSVEQEKLLGRNVLAFLNYGEGATEAAPIWALIGGQRDASYNDSADEIDVSDKNSSGYGDSEPGMKTIELTIELIVKTNDETVNELRDAYDNDEAVDILRWSKNGRSIRNWYIITGLEESATYDDAAILSVTLKGKGKPTYTEQMEDPRGTTGA